MQTATLRGRRGVDYRRALPVRAPGWRLVFDKPPLIPQSSAAANMVVDSDAEVLGVAFEITADELAHIELTEGVLIGNYRRIEVRLEPLHEGAAAPTRAFSLASDHRDPSLRPSTRYMRLVIDGALEHGLPPEYVTFLRSVAVEAESPEILALQPFIDEALRRR